MASHSTQLQNSDVQTSEEELARLEEQKNSKVQEMLVVAGDIKRLVKEKEDTKKTIDEEVAEKRRAADEEIALIEQSIASAHSRKAQAERDLMLSVTGSAKKELEEVLSARDTAKKERDEEQQKLQSKKKEVAESKAEFDRLSVLKHNLEDAIKDDRSDLKSLKEESQKLIVDLPPKRTELATASENHDKVIVHMEMLKVDEAKLEASVKEKNKILDGILGQINERNGTLVELTNKVNDAEKTHADKEVAIEKRDADSTERAGNATRLEQHVDAKLAHLKSIEANHTTEHLARFGYKKTE